MIVAPVTRRPAVAGYYYPAEPEALRMAVDALTPVHSSPSSTAYAIIAPHGSYQRSGAIAGAAFSQVAIPRRCIVLGPSHTGSWMPWSLMAAGAYRTPLGDVPIDEACAEALRLRCPFFEVDAWAQRGEHAIEVLLPFLQRRGPADLTIVPIIIGSEDQEELGRLAEALAQVIRMSEERVLLVASSDLSHYETQERAAAQDRLLIEAMCALDAGQLTRTVQDRSILMCGYGAVASVLSAATALGARRGRLTQYGTSVEAGGDPDSATGYAGLIVEYA